MANNKTAVKRDTQHKVVEGETMDLDGGATLEIEGGDMELADDTGEDAGDAESVVKKAEKIASAEPLQLAAITKVKVTPLEQIAFLMAEVVEGADVALLRKLVGDSVPKDQAAAAVFQDRLMRFRQAVEVAISVAHSVSSHNALGI